MTEPNPHHDSAAFLEVAFNPSFSRKEGRGGGPNGNGWYVGRTCACHRGAVVSIAFATRAEAEWLIRVLDDDCRQRINQKSLVAN